MGRGIRTYIRGYAKDAAQDAAQDVAEDVTQDVAQDEAFGARAARALNATPPPPPLPQSLCSSRLAEMGGATGQPNGIWLGLWARASGGAAQSASMSVKLPQPWEGSGARVGPCGAQERPMRPRERRRAPALPPHAARDLEASLSAASTAGISTAAASTNATGSPSPESLARTAGTAMTVRKRTSVRVLRPVTRPTEITFLRGRCAKVPCSSWELPF